MDDELLTVNEVAEALQLHQQTIRNWIDRGDLPAVRLGPRRVRVRRSDLNQILGVEASTKLGTAEPPEPETHAAEQVQRLDRNNATWASLYRHLAEIHSSRADADPLAMIGALRSLGTTALNLADEIVATKYLDTAASAPKNPDSK